MTTTDDLPQLLLQRQEELQAEADVVSRDLQLAERLSVVGEPVRVGSAALGLMVRRDLDVTVVCPALDAAATEAVAQIGARLAVHPRIRQVRFRDDTGHWNSDPAYPDGLYLGLRYRSPMGRDWTLDIWFVDEPERQPDLTHLQTMPARLTPDVRGAILRIKDVWADRPAYGKSVTGYDVYRSVLDDGVRTPEQFERWASRRPTRRSPHPLTRFEQLVDRASSLVAGGKRAILGITGPPGTGKTTLAEELVRALAPVPPDGLAADARVAHVPMDGFHLADVELDRLGRRHRKGAPDTFDAAGYAALLRRLREDEDEIVYAPGFERTLEQPIAGAIPVPRAARLIITEGNYLLVEDGGWAGVRAQLDEVWYADLDPAVRMQRLIDRHVRFGKDQAAAAEWAGGTDERNAVLISSTRPRADLVVPADLMRSLGIPPDAVTRP